MAASMISILHARREAERDENFTHQGFRALRFWNNEIDRNLEGVPTLIDDALRIPPPGLATLGHPPPAGLTWAHIFLSHINGFRAKNLRLRELHALYFPLESHFGRLFLYSRVHRAVRNVVPSQTCVPKLALRGRDKNTAIQPVKITVSRY